MDATQRRDCILRFINAKQSVNFEELKILIPDTSEMTIRRDLEYLSKHNKIIRVFGGAKSMDFLTGAGESSFPARSIKQAKSKELIARKTLPLLEKRSIVFLGSGTTTWQFSRLFPNGNYFVTTTAMNCAMELSSLPDVTLYMLGGTVNKVSFCVNGTIAQQMLQNMNFDIAFLGCHGYLPGRGFTTSVIEDYAVRQQVIQNSTCTAILMDSSKTRHTGVTPLTFALASQVEYVVSDDALDPHIRAELEEAGVTVL